MPISRSGLDKGEIIGKNRLEDVRWLACLSDSELDLLISLKQLVIQRAKVVGREHIAKNFDLKILRALAFIMMKYFKNRLKDSPVISSSAFLNESSNHLNLDCKDGFDSCIEDILPLIDSISRKRVAERPCEGLSHQKKQNSDS